MKKLILLISLILVNYSCNQDDLTLEESTINTTSIDEITVKNGRLYFPNKETFKQYYKEMSSKKEDEIAQELSNKFYSNNFYSLIPIVNEQTEKVQIERHLTHFKNITQAKNNSLYNRSLSDEDILEDFDDLEDVFGEEVFNSFLNQEAELQVAHQIYKYTDTGLFITDVEKINDLNLYLDEQQISRDLLEPTPEITRIAYIEETNPCGGVTQVQDFQYFIAEDAYSESCGGSGYSGGTGSGSTSGGSTQPSGTPNYELALISQSLEQCSGSSPFFGNLFGTVKVCHDNYEDKKRVKIKYYDIDLYLTYAMGIKVKHQKKGWTGLWRKQDTDEVALGVNSLTYRFNHAPDLNAISTNHNARIYLHNNKMYETLNGYYNAVYQGNIPVPDLPFSNSFKNEVDWLVEVAVGYHPGWDSEEDVREFFYETLFDTTKNIFQSYSNRQNMKRGVVVVKAETSTWVQVYDFTNKCTNCDKREVVLDWGFVTPEFTYTFGSGSGTGLSVSSWDYDFRNPDVVNLSAYGMAKRNGQWHGKRFVF